MTNFSHHTAHSFVFLPFHFGGGFVGGLAQYYFISHEPTPDRVDAPPRPIQILSIGFLGAVAGTIGFSTIAARLNKNLSLYDHFVGAMATGFSYKLVFNSIAALLMLSSKVEVLESAQISQIETLSKVAVSNDPATAKAIAIHELSNIADRDWSNREITSKAIDNLNSTAKQANPSLKLQTIAKLQAIATDPDTDPKVRAKVISDLEDYANGGYDKEVKAVAEEALSVINNHPLE